MKAAFSYGQEMVSVFFAIKLKNFVLILILLDKYLPFPDQDSPPPPPPPPPTPPPPPPPADSVLGEYFCNKNNEGC